MSASGQWLLTAWVAQAAVPATSPDSLLVAKDHVHVTYLDHSTQWSGVRAHGPGNPCSPRSGVLRADRDPASLFISRRGTVALPPSLLGWSTALCFSAAGHHPHGGIGHPAALILPNSSSELQKGTTRSPATQGRPWAPPGSGTEALLSLWTRERARPLHCPPARRQLLCRPLTPFAD